jgi:hypothetical protein
LIGAASLYLGVKLARRRLFPPTSASGEGSLYTIPFNVFWSLVVVTVLHGASALKLLAILTLNYCIAKQCKGSKLGPTLTLIFNGFVLFANELNHGYRFGAISPSLEYLVRVLNSFRPCVCDLTEVYLGRDTRALPSLACHIQHDHAAIDIIQHGLLLGSCPSRTPSSTHLPPPKHPQPCETDLFSLDC